MDIIRLDFKSGLEALLKSKPIRAIFLGVRIGDPTAVSFMLYVDKYMISQCIFLLARIFSINFLMISIQKLILTRNVHLIVNSKKYQY